MNQVPLITGSEQKDEDLTALERGDLVVVPVVDDDTAVHLADDILDERVHPVVVNHENDEGIVHPHQGHHLDLVLRRKQTIERRKTNQINVNPIMTKNDIKREEEIQKGENLVKRVDENDDEVRISSKRDEIAVHQVARSINSN